MNLTQFAENVRLMKKIATLMSLKLVQVAHLQHSINVISQILWILYADSVLMVNKIAKLIKIKHVMNAIQLNQLFYQVHINVIEWIL